jgi:protein-disulfide isomerase
MTGYRNFPVRALILLMLAMPIGEAQDNSAPKRRATQGAPQTNSAATSTPSGITKQQAKAILNELRQIRHLLEEQQRLRQQAESPAPGLENVKMSADRGYSLGRSDASLTLVEFADYQCPYCRQFHTAVFEKLKKNYIDTGKLRFVSRDLPLDIHSGAFKAAQAARCAGDQNNFWPMRDTLITHADSLNDDSILTYARQLGLEMVRFRSCLDTGKYLPDIHRDITEANSVGISVTPSFVLGEVSAGTIDGVKVVGAQSYAAFEGILAGHSAKRVASGGRRP